MWNATEAVFSRSSSFRECSEDDEEEALRWAALERLPTYSRVRRGILRGAAGDCSEVDVARLSSGDRTALIDRLLVDSGDAEHFFRRIRQRFDAMTLLLGPPSSGKTTLLLALAGRLGNNLQALALEGKQTNLVVEYILKKVAKYNITLGEAALKEYGMFTETLGKQQAVVSKSELKEREKRRKGEKLVIELRSYLSPNILTGTNGKELQKGMRIPGWWRWYYWADPISWTLYGLLTSQFGDVDAPMNLSDGIHSVSIKLFLKHHFGFRHEFLGVVAVMVVGFCIIFAVSIDWYIGMERIVLSTHTAAFAVHFGTLAWCMKHGFRQQPRKIRSCRPDGFLLCFVGELRIIPRFSPYSSLLLYFRCEIGIRFCVDYKSSVLLILLCTTVSCCSTSREHLMPLEKTLASLAGEVQELKSKREAVSRELEAAKDQGLEPKSRVIEWMESIQQLETETGSLNEELSRLKRRGACSSLSANSSSSEQLIRKAEEEVATAGELKRNGEFRKVGFDEKLLKVGLSDETLVPVEALEQLRRHATDGCVSIVGVHGMGLAGKTALLRSLHDDFLKHDTDYDVVIYLEVRGEVMDVQSSLCKELSFPCPETPIERRDLLFGVLSKSNFALLLDDLWEPLNCELVGVPIPDPSTSKIIVASRLEDVCSGMGAQKTIKVEGLAEKQAWDLFKSTLWGRQPNDEDMIIIYRAKAMVFKCGGLAAALVTTAREMKDKKTSTEWKEKGHIMRNAPHELPGMEKEVLGPLKRSYDRLPGDLQKCASCFALQAEGRPISKDQLMELWMGEGIIADFENICDAMSRASHLLQELTAASSIKRLDDETFEMHPMVRAMILWVANGCEEGKNKWYVRVREWVTQTPDAGVWNVAERIALSGNVIEALPDNPDCPKLVYLDLGSNQRLKPIPDGFFDRMPCLRVLNLQHVAIEKIPENIGHLVLLEYLSLCQTRIQTLPSSIRKLANLKHLILRSTNSLRDVAGGIMSGLEKLQWLHMMDSYSGWSTGEPGEMGASLGELEGLGDLRALGITIATVDALRRLCRSRMLAKRTHWLQIEACKGLTSFRIPSSFSLGKAMLNLIELRLHELDKLKEVVFSESAAALSNLKRLRLSDLRSAKLTWRGSCLQNLEELEIEGCNGIDAALIRLKDEGAMDGSQTITILPNLKRIKLKRMQRLQSLSDGDREFAFPRLETMEVEDCPKLRKLSLVAPELKEIRCEVRWWRQLDWEDDRTKCFDKLFKAL
ncbi:Plant PDR ABC transporter associated [Musa troglodytarum]|uniref:Plant PDR ABC transporter associated n=1 Tax=Musa troglodytarum TaxID=320322 RepID=A0A9E7GMW4_9LILI|nr:Plant PDR ABC transporter associated [Musa troglodytarum]